MTCFRSLSNTLEETFSATAQSEDELNYASATLILAGLLQIHARTPRYATHRARLESFPNRTQSEVTPIHRGSSSHPQQQQRRREQHLLSIRPSPEELASAGFFHTGAGDETVCPACGLGLRDWQATDQPEACHLAYSTAEVGLSSSGDGVTHLPTPALPCLYLAVHRLLASELPLARKSLVPPGPIQSIGTLPGVVSSPVFNFANDGLQERADGFVSLADRLRAIQRIMTSPPSPQGWPIENARALGHSDDMIVLALWRLQSESTNMGLGCPPTTALRLDPQATAELLRAILRLQESFDNGLRDIPAFDSGSMEGEVDETLSTGSDTELTAEDAETAALSRCRFQRIPSTSRIQLDSATSPLSVDSTGLPIKRVPMPRFDQFLSWWSSRWPAGTTDCK